MRNRRFSFQASAAALAYITRLLNNGIAFSVEPKTDRVDVITPFNLGPGDFPPAGDLK